MGFSDVAPDFWGIKDIERLVDSGLMSGYPDGSFKPNQNMTRAEYASGIARLTFQMCLLYKGLVDRLMPAVFLLYRDVGGFGTAFYVSPDGLIQRSRFNTVHSR